MMTTVTPGGPVSARRLAELLGSWREPGARRAAADLAGGVRLLVTGGQLPAGTRLPAERELAEALGVSRTLVTAALDRLRADGFAASRRGAGSWLTLPDRRRPAEPPDAPELIDLARAAPEAPAGLLAAFDTARLRLPEYLRGHGYHQRGLPDLRARIAARFVARGLPTAPDQIVVTAGSHLAFALVLRMVAHPGDRVLVEQPTYPNALEAIRASNAIPVGVPMVDDGWSLDAVEAALSQSAPRLAYFVLDFHNPTGHRLDDAGRARLAAALRRTRTLAVVDETLVELDLDGDPVLGPAPMAGFAEDQVITVGSASKSHWGGLRLGWVRAPSELADRLVAARASLDLGVPLFEQLVLAELLADPGALAGTLADRRRELAARRDLLLAELARHCPAWRIGRPAGGLSLWCALDRPVSTRLAVAGEAHGLRLVPGARFGVDGGLERWLRVPFTLPPAELADAAARLGRLAGAVGGARAAGTVPVT